MKNLIIIRHAKAEQTFGNDKERHLTERGITDAQTMAKRLVELGYKLDKIFTSPSDRTLETTVAFAEANELSEADVVIFEKLYLGDTLQITEAVNWLQQNITTLAVVGHNPGVSNFTSDVTGEHIEDLPTCGIAIIAVDADNWQNFDGAVKKLVKVITPKD